jgi:hypothetical protein
MVNLSIKNTGSMKSSRPWEDCSVLEGLARQKGFYTLRYPNNSSTAMRHPGTAGSASANRKSPLKLAKVES